MRNFCVTLGEWAFVAFCFVMMILISLADRFGKKKGTAPEASAEASPQEAEHQAWRAWYITKEAGTPKAQLLAEAVIKAFHAAQAMSRAQVAALPASSPSSPAETK